MFQEAPPTEREAGTSASHTPPDREPISNTAPTAYSVQEDTAPPAAAPPPPSAREMGELPEEQEIAEVVDRVVIHTHKPMENLPELALPELKVIGRCITFKGDTLMDGDLKTMYYEGLVGTINKDTVSLIHVHRFTEPDFQLHYALMAEAVRKEKEAATSAEYSEEELRRMRERDQSSRMHGDNLHRELVAFPTGDYRTSDALAYSAPAGEDDLALEANPSTLPCPNESGETTEEHGEATKRVRNRLRNHTGSMGPIPFVSFSRTHIHEVQFGRDPRSDFYSLFQDPTKEFFDMQCLRMFCRRYIVHTAQGNNPRQIPLRAFVTCRCNCPDLDNDLLQRVTKEEIGHLVKVDRDVKRTRKSGSALDRQAEAFNYDAPPGIFQNTGILHAFKIPQRFFIFGICLIALAIIIAIIFGVMQRNVDANVIWYYGSTFISYVIASIVIWIVTGVLLLLLSTRISMPIKLLSFTHLGILLFLAASIGCGLMCLVVFARGLTVDSIYRFFARTTKPIRLIQYYAKHKCSGFTQNCSSLNVTYMKCDSPIALQYSTPCVDRMMSDVQKLLIPVIVLSVFAVIVSFFAILTHSRAVSLSNRALNGQILVRRTRRNRIA